MLRSEIKKGGNKWDPLVFENESDYTTKNISNRWEQQRKAWLNVRCIEVNHSIDSHLEVMVPKVARLRMFEVPRKGNSCPLTNSILKDAPSRKQ